MRRTWSCRKVKLRATCPLTSPLSQCQPCSGSNPTWRTWQGALATPAHSAAGVVVAAWPRAPTPASPLIPPCLNGPGDLQGNRPLEERRPQPDWGPPCLRLHRPLVGQVKPAVEGRRVGLFHSDFNHFLPSGFGIPQGSALGGRSFPLLMDVGRHLDLPKMIIFCVPKAAFKVLSAFLADSETSKLLHSSLPVKPKVRRWFGRGGTALISGTCTKLRDGSHASSCRLH